MIEGLREIEAQRRLLRALAESPPLLAETFAELAQDRDAVLGVYAADAEEEHGP